MISFSNRPPAKNAPESSVNVTEGKIDTWKLVDHVPHLVSPQCYQLRIQLYVHVQKDEKNN